MTNLVDQSFIVVKYGDNREALFNPWCSSYTLMEWIRRKCNCDEDITLDLVDLEGQVKNLSTRSKEYASDVVNPRETYILIRVEKYSDGKHHYTSLLDNLEEVNPDLMVKLNSISRPQTRNKNRKGKNNTKQQTSLKPNRQENSAKRPTSSERRKTAK